MTEYATFLNKVNSLKCLLDRVSSLRFLDNLHQLSSLFISQYAMTPSYTVTALHHISFCVSLKHLTLLNFRSLTESDLLVLCKTQAWSDLKEINVQPEGDVHRWARTIHENWRNIRLAQRIIDFLHRQLLLFSR